MKEKIRKIIRKLRQLKMRAIPSKSAILLKSEMRLSLPPQVLREIRELMDKTETRQPVDIFRKSLAAYDLLTDHVAEGGKIILRSASGEDLIFDPISFKEETND